MCRCSLARPPAGRRQRNVLRSLHFHISPQNLHFAILDSIPVCQRFKLFAFCPMQCPVLPKLPCPTDVGLSTSFPVRLCGLGCRVLRTVQGGGKLIEVKGRRNSDVNFLDVNSFPLNIFIGNFPILQPIFCCLPGPANWPNNANRKFPFTL